MSHSCSNDVRPFLPLHRILALAKVVLRRVTSQGSHFHYDVHPRKWGSPLAGLSGQHAQIFKVFILRCDRLEKICCRNLWLPRVVLNLKIPLLAPEVNRLQPYNVGEALTADSLEGIWTAIRTLQVAVHSCGSHHHV